MKDEFLIQGMDCVSCSLSIEHALKKIAGVNGVKINFAVEKVVVDYEAPATKEHLIKAVADLGYKLIPI